MTDDLNKVNTPRGDGALSMTTLPSNVVTNSNTAQGQGADWLGPLAPMTPLQPATAGRQFDLRPGYNLATEPRAYEEIGFPELRALADACDVVRLLIEKRKDQICRLPWAIRFKHDGIGKRPTAAQLSPAQRALVRDVQRFFQHPAPGVNFRGWLRSLLEDLLVIDQPSIFCDRDPFGNLAAMPVLDGATLKLIIGDDGRRPVPWRYDGRPFTWLGREVAPDDLDPLGFRIVDGLLWPPIAQQSLHGLPASNLSDWDVFISPRNLRSNKVYGFSPVQQIITTISTAMRRAMSQLEYFREGNQVDAFYSLPESWSPDKIQQFQDYFDSMMSGDLANRRKMKFMPGGGDYTATKEPPLKNAFDEYLARVCCFALGYPPGALVALSNKSIAEQHERSSEEEGEGPVKNWFCDLANAILEREFDPDLEFVFTEEDDVDQEKQKDILTGYQESGNLTINQVRAKLGEEPDSNPAANMLMVMTPTGLVPIDANLPGNKVVDDAAITSTAATKFEVPIQPLRKN